MNTTKGSRVYFRKDYREAWGKIETSRHNLLEFIAFPTSESQVSISTDSTKVLKLSPIKADGPSQGLICAIL